MMRGQQFASTDWRVLMAERRVTGAAEEAKGSDRIVVSIGIRS